MYIVMITRDYQNCNFNCSCAGARPYKLYTGNILFILNIMQNEGRGKMNKGEITKIVNFKTSKAGVLVLGRGGIVKMQYFFFSCCLHIFQTN